MNESAYSVAASIMRYFFLAVLCYVVAAAALRSAREFRRVRSAQRLAGLPIRGIELLVPKCYEGEWHPLGADNTIGGGEEDDLSLPKTDLKRSHIRIYEHKGEMLFKTRQKRFCEVNGRRPKGRSVALADGDVVWARDVCFRCLKHRPHGEEGGCE